MICVTIHRYAPALALSQGVFGWHFAIAGYQLLAQQKPSVDFSMVEDMDSEAGMIGQFLSTIPSQ
jgi:hypothetical protein